MISICEILYNLQKNKTQPSTVEIPVSNSLPATNIDNEIPVDQPQKRITIINNTTKKQTSVGG